jgi:hypothetical protein
MLKQISNGLNKFFTIERTILLIVLIILAYGLYMYSNSKSRFMDGMDTGFPKETAQSITPTVAVDQTEKAVVSAEPSFQSNYVPQSVASPQDLLPQDQNSQWASLNPAGQGNIAAPDLLQAGYHIGLDTIGQTLRNANLQERSDPIIPKSLVGPWNQSTIEPDLGRVPLEVGVGVR